MSQKIVETSLPIEKWFDTLTEPVDVYITDPPYPFDNRNGRNRFNYVDGQDYMYNRLGWKELGDVYTKMYETAPDGARAYVFCNKDGLVMTMNLMEDAGWTFRNIIVWDKINMGMGYHWRNSVEFIVYATKGKPKTYIQGSRNLISCKKPRTKDAIPEISYKPEGTSPKPHQIWSTIIDKGCVDGDVIADPFAGSNPMRAALLLDKDLMKKVKLAYTNSYDV